MEVLSPLEPLEAITEAVTSITDGLTEAVGAVSDLGQDLSESLIPANFGFDTAPSLPTALGSSALSMSSVELASFTSAPSGYSGVTYEVSPSLLRPPNYIERTPATRTTNAVVREMARETLQIPLVMFYDLHRAYFQKKLEAVGLKYDA